MLLAQTQIRFARNGEAAPVEFFSISDKIYNDLTGFYDEITDILLRAYRPKDHPVFGSRANLFPASMTSPHLAPVFLPAGAVAKGAPNLDTWLSPKQGILVVEKAGADGRYNHLNERRADEFAATPCPSVSCPSASGTIYYYCLFFGVQRFVESNGLRLTTYTTQDSEHVRL